VVLVGHTVSDDIVEIDGVTVLAIRAMAVLGAFSGAQANFSSGARQVDFAAFWRANARVV
jgi:hypothetical protein